ncbi:glycine-rich domain-containing protein 1 isoform X2 [Alnus glutinosa]|nr:glycine-rich domain-containing protein 1 isoform X2 [Alnus glutinosa]XP_062178239.1 glycine-rich domain-containing protein 1 isoform X2 [Alnus glutinosa]
MRCKEIWTRKYPSEPFENETDSDMPIPVATNEQLLVDVTEHRFLYSKFSEAYRSEIVYLIAARQRYKGFLCLVQRFSDECSRSVPASDVLLMWLTHQTYPTVFAEDLKEMEGDMGKVVSVWESVKEKEVKETNMLWERTYDQPYEKAGGEVLESDKIGPVKQQPIHWEVSNTDVNTKYKSMLPRFLLEVCVFLKLNSRMKPAQQDVTCEFLRLSMLRCHRELKLDKSISDFRYDSWHKAWKLYCEFGTKGVVIELRREGGHCFKGSSLQATVTFHWNDLLRAHSLTLEREVAQQARIVASITPPVQAPYLLKCVPDRVTDNSGAMISDVILRMNRYRPQEGRWLSRTVLDHAGRECFVVRMRVGGGFWRRGGETPTAVKWDDRIIEIREGSWSYVAGPIGRAPEKVVGTATPKEPPEQWKAAWKFSTGDELMIGWESSTSLSSLSFCLGNQMSPEPSVKLLKGRKMQYQVKNIKSENKKEEEGKEEEDEEEEGFVTLVRFTEENPIGRATALLNWKLLVVELLPEEDAVMVLLLCISILRSVSMMKKEDVGCLLTRRRLKEAKLGARDWGSVILHPSSCSSSISSPYLQPWCWNAKAVMGSDGADHITRQPAFNYSPVEGSDDLYKRGIIT